MAVFINPIEILKLDSLDISAIDGTAVKKAKRQLFADIDLSDTGHLEYKGNTLSKNDCEAAINQLDNPVYIDYYHYLAHAPLLSDFLASGKEDWFSQYKQDDIYGDLGFRMFIGTYLAPRLDRSLVRAFLDKDGAQLKSMLKGLVLLQPAEVDVAFRGLSREIQTRIDDTEKLRDRVKDENNGMSASELPGMAASIQNWFPIAVLNPLPSYFQSQINKIANTINFLQLAIWDRFEEPDVPTAMLEHLLQLNIESADKPTFEKNYEIIHKRHTQKKVEKEHAEQLGRWIEALATIKKKAKMVESKIEKPTEVAAEIRNIAPIKELNELPAYGDGIRTDIATAIRTVAIASWNHNDDIRSSLILIRHAIQLIVPKEVKDGFNKDLTDLQDMEKKYQGVVTCYFCGSRPPVDGCGHKTTIYKETSREWFPQRRVEYKYIDVTLPRCKSCKEAHDKSNEFMLYFAVIGTVVAALIGTITPGQHFIIGGIIGLGVGLLAGYLQKRSRLQNANVHGTGNATLRNHPMLSDYMRDGWSFNKPSA
jgi:hypothetical protein